MIFDGHNDTLTALYALGDRRTQAFLAGNHAGHVDLPRARKGGLTGGFFAIFTPPPPGSPERDPMYGLTFTEDGYDVRERSPIEQAYAQAYTDSVIAFAHDITAQSNDTVRIATSYTALEQGLRQNQFVMVLHLEGAEAIQSDLSNLDTYYHKGVRSIGLVWSRPNAFGHGVPFRFPHSPDTGAGLTDAGMALVEACNTRGILIDLAHLNARGFHDVAELSKAPLVVTHADVHAICPSTRNLTDDQIDAVGNSNGVIGINFETLNTHPHSDPRTDVPLTQITRHIDYIARRIGIDHVAFGSDFDGATMPDALRDASHLPALIAQLEADGFDHAAIEKITCGNWLRVLRDIWRD